MVVAEFAVQILIKKRSRIVGKVLRDGRGKRVFYRQYPLGTAKLRLLNSLSLDLRVFKKLSKWRVSEIHFEATSGDLYTVKLRNLDGLVDNYGEADQLYIPMSTWRKTTRKYQVPWTNKVVEVG